MNSFISALQAFNLIGSGSSVILNVTLNYSRIESLLGLANDLNQFSISPAGPHENILNSSELRR